MHVSTADGIETIRQARARGLKVYGETCPQYLLLTAKDLDRPGLEGAMFCCSPPPRDESAQAACWQGLKDDALWVFSSDHAPYRYDASGKLPKGEKTTFKDMANGLPGLELRMPLLFTYGYRRGPDDAQRVRRGHLDAPCADVGLYPRKGTIAVGADADLAIWDPAMRVRVTKELVHDNAGYTPYEGRDLTGWPVVVISRGDVIVEDGKLHAERGRGQFVACERAKRSKPLGRQVPEMAQLAAWNTPLDSNVSGRRHVDASCIKRGDCALFCRCELRARTEHVSRRKRFASFHRFLPAARPTRWRGAVRPAISRRVTLVGKSPLVITVHPSVPAKTLNELIAARPYPVAQIASARPAPAASPPTASSRLPLPRRLRESHPKRDSEMDGGLQTHGCKARLTVGRGRA